MAKSTQHRKGRWAYGRRVYSSGAPTKALHRKTVWGSRRQDGKDVVSYPPKFQMKACGEFAKVG